MGALRRLWDTVRGAPVGGTKGLTIMTQDGFIAQDVAQRLWSLGTDSMLDTNVVMSPVNWVLRNFTEADSIVERRTNGIWERDEDHALTRLLETPNPYYGEALLWKATVLSYCLDGNAYWMKVRNTFGEVLGYWYMPHFAVTPKWPQDGSIFISHYEYRPISGQGPIILSVKDVVHFRFGLDPRNTRLGMSQLKPILREVFTDEEAATFSAAILGNMGVPGGVISPSNKDALPGQDDVDRMKQHMQGFRGERRGEWLVLGTPTDIKQFGFDPNNLTLGNLRDIAEERVCAALGVPAAVVGFGSGLQQTKVGATMRELRREAWDSCIRPMQNDMAKQLDRQALPDFVTQLKRFRVRFDASDFSASQEQESEKSKRVATLVEAGILRVDRAQQMLGLEVDPSRAIYLGAGSAPKPGAAEDNGIPAALAARMNGNGAATQEDAP
jgi:HK97 family phage portal protein